MIEAHASLNILKPPTASPIIPKVLIKKPGALISSSKMMEIRTGIASPAPMSRHCSSERRSEFD